MADKRASSRVLDPATLGAIAEAIKPRPLAAERKQALRARLLDRVNAAPAGTRTIRAYETQWQPVFERIEVKVLHRDPRHNIQTALWRLQPGAVFPDHGHGVEEECLVLEGEISIGGHRIHQGDLHIASRGCEHAGIVSETGALLLIRSEIVDLQQRQ